MSTAASDLAVHEACAEARTGDTLALRGRGLHPRHASYLVHVAEAVSSLPTPDDGDDYDQDDAWESIPHDPSGCVDYSDVIDPRDALRVACDHLMHHAAAEDALEH